MKGSARIFVFICVLFPEGKHLLFTKWRPQQDVFHSPAQETLASHMASLVEYFDEDDNEDCTFCCARTYPVIEQKIKNSFDWLFYRMLLTLTVRLIWHPWCSYWQMTSLYWHPASCSALWGSVTLSRHPAGLRRQDKVNASWRPGVTRLICYKSSLSVSNSVFT